LVTPSGAGRKVGKGHDLTLPEWIAAVEASGTADADAIAT
jgi:hypothetical protein